MLEDSGDCEEAELFSLGKQLTLGFLLPQDIDTCLANPYLVDVIRGLGRVCQENGYMLSIIPPLNDSLYEAVKNATVDGLVTMGYLGDGVSSLVDLIVMPLVMIDGGDDDAFLSINIDDEAAACDDDAFLSINIDDEAASCLQLEKALEAGHRRISIVSLPAPTLEPDANDSGIVACRMRVACAVTERRSRPMALMKDTYASCRRTRRPSTMDGGRHRR